MLPRSCWIIEDEPPALRRLRRMLQQVAPQTEIAFSADSIAPARRALLTLPHPDLIFSDIQLADGLSFELWESTPCTCPIVFTTAYDQYSIRAFGVNGIDYLLKPVGEDELLRSLQKLDRLRHSPPPDWSALLATLQQPSAPRYRERFLAQYRQDWVPVPVDELRQLYSTDGMTFTTAIDGKRYLLDKPLDHLEPQLDPKFWFRINRAQIVHVAAVRKVSPYFNHRLVLELMPGGEGDNVVSRSRVLGCREWLGR